MKDDLKVFIPFSKKDDVKREVYGYASTEALDSQGEVVERSAIEAALPDYLGDYDAKTGRFRFGNIREMHRSSAVGKAFKAIVDNKGLFLGGKVVDDNAWNKVKEGVYAGFSIGGRIVKKVGNRIKNLKLSEVSLVDRPANPEAVFSMVKFDDVRKEEMEVMEMQNEEVLIASHILNLAKDIRFLLNIFDSEGRSVTELQKSLDLLKELAIKVLNGEDREKFDKILYGMDLMELDKRKLSSKQRADMDKAKFAYIDSKGGKHLPINDAAHVRNALARFNQTDFESPAKKRTAARKIMAAARKFNIEVSPDSAVARAIKNAIVSNLNKFYELDWSTKYFDIQKKVMG